MIAPPAFSPGSLRRARLEQLREEADPLVAGERRAALRALLQHPLLTPDGPYAEAFVLVRKHRDWLRAWFAHHAEWSLAVSAEVARLRKFPNSSLDATRGAADPRGGEAFSRTRYVLLCLALAVLERSDRQITLGRLAEAIMGALAAEPAFAEADFIWSLDATGGRRDFVHALRLLLALGVLRRIQGDEERFLHDRASDALYNVVRPVLAAVLACRRSPSRVSADGIDSRIAALLEETTRPDTPDARNRAIRTALARRLLDDPVLAYDTLTEEEKMYLDRQRGFLLPDLTEATGLESEVRAEGIALTDLDGDCSDIGLPEEGTEGHLTLLLATWLADQLRSAPTPAAVIVSEEAVRRQTARFIRRHRRHWRRDVAEAGAEAWLAELVLGRLASLGLIERGPDGLCPLPVIARYGLRPAAGADGSEEIEELPLT